jgi:heat shock protein HslJ
MRRSLPAAAILLVLAILAVGCGSDEGDAQGGSLEGVTWVLDASSIAALVEQAPADARVDIAFEAAEASGTSGCNSYRGEYTVEGDGIEFGAFAATQMACEQPLMDLEAAYLAALGDVSAFEVGGGNLSLTGGGVSLSYVEEPPVEALPLTGTAWRLTTIAVDDAVSSTIAGTEVTAGFGDDGVVAGTDGCNRYSAEYTASDGSLMIGQLAGTLMACEPDVDAQAQVFRQAMQTAAAFEIEGTSLSLLDDAGNLVLAFAGGA